MPCPERVGGGRGCAGLAPREQHRWGEVELAVMVPTRVG